MKISGIEISHPEKIIFPVQKITKADMAGYYDKMADRMLPYLKERPLTLRRFPNGIAQSGFFQKHAQDHYPDFIQRITVKTEDGKAEEIMCNNKKSLIYLVNQGTVSFHIWLARKNDLHRPDKVVIDLDPSGNADFKKVKKAARAVQEILAKKGTGPNLMTTGKRGIHIVYGSNASQEFDKVRTAVREIGEQLVEKYPDLFTLETRKDKRGNGIFFDYLRNAYGQTSICPFSLRPNESAGVATPLEWDELGKIKSGDHYRYGNIFRRLGAKGS